MATGHDPDGAPPGRGGLLRRDWRRWTWIAIAVISAFIIGFAWQGVRANLLQGRLEQTRQALALHRLEGSLAAAMYEARRGSFEVARQHASAFFTGLQTTLPDTPPAVRQELSELLAQRDLTITMLSRGDPEAGDVLAAQYVRYRTARASAEEALPQAE